MHEVTHVKIVVLNIKENQCVCLYPTKPLFPVSSFLSYFEKKKLSSKVSVSSF
jgi:hypothetical protein